MDAVTTTSPPVLLTAVNAATYAGVRPATLRVWRHRYGLTPRWTGDGSSLYDFDELAAILARRAGDQEAEQDLGVSSAAAL